MVATGELQSKDIRNIINQCKSHRRAPTTPIQGVNFPNTCTCDQCTATKPSPTTCNQPRCTQHVSRAVLVAQTSADAKRKALSPLGEKSVSDITVTLISNIHCWLFWFFGFLGVILLAICD